MEIITPVELQAAIAANTKIRLIDVREPQEWQQGHIAGAIHIPLAELPKRLGDMDSEEQVVCYCKMGGRSARACALMEAAGFKHLKNLQGGIYAWGEQVDPSLMP